MDENLKNKFDELLSEYAKILNHNLDKNDNIENLYEEVCKLNGIIKELEECKKKELIEKNKIKKDYNNLLLYCKSFESSSINLNEERKTTKNSSFDALKVEIINLKESLNNELKEKSTMQFELNECKITNHKLKTLNDKYVKIIKEESKIIHEESKIRNNLMQVAKEKYDKIINDKIEEYNELFAKYKILMDDYETLKRDKESNLEHFNNHMKNEIFIGLKNIEILISQITNNN